MFIFEEGSTKINWNFNFVTVDYDSFFNFPINFELFCEFHFNGLIIVIT